MRLSNEHMGGVVAKHICKFMCFKYLWASLHRKIQKFLAGGCFGFESCKVMAKCHIVLIDKLCFVENIVNHFIHRNVQSRYWKTRWSKPKKDQKVL